MISIIIPTYNESDSIASLVKQIFETTGYNGIDTQIIVVDDNSPDGTGEIAYYLKRFFPKLKTLHRSHRLGKTSAINEGIEHCDGNIIGIMDGNFTHPPSLIPTLLTPIFSGYVDIAIASQYAEKTKNNSWSAQRKSLHRLGTLICRPLTAVKDPLSGFFFLTKKILYKTPLNDYSPKILLDILTYSHFNKAQEIPYHFNYCRRHYPNSSAIPWKNTLPFLAQLARLYWVKIKS